MTIKEALCKAIDNRDPILAAQVVDTVRFRFGLPRSVIINMIERHRPEFTEADWEVLMQEYEDYESKRS